MPEPAVSVEEMIAFLREPSAYTHHPPGVTLQQTHASLLAIAPPYVFKVKKRVNLGFMDFTTLPQRRENCEREIRLNSRLCPQLYVGIVPIRMHQGALTFGEAGEVVDYALQMHQLADGFFLHQLLRTAQITPHDLDPVLNRLAQFYAGQQTDATVAEFGETDAIRANADENFTALREYPVGPVSALALAVIEEYTHTFLRQNAALFKKRTRTGRIIDGHGDLHLDHIHLHQGTVCMYDCVEFNDRFRCLDVASDLAFLTMDFDFHGRPDLAAYVTSRMADLLQDPDLCRLMDFYKCYRACVRAKVESITSREAEVGEKARTESRHRAGRYGQLALQYACTGSRPAVLMVGGRIGSGKSTLARRLAELLGFPLVSSDALRKEGAGLPLLERTSPQDRQWLYAPERTDQVYAALLEAAVSSTGRQTSVILDATFGAEKYRQLFLQSFTRAGIRYWFIEADAPDDVIKRRLAGRENQSAVISDARLDDFETLSRRYEPVTEIPAAYTLNIRTDRPEAEALAILLREMSRRQIHLPS